MNDLPKEIYFSELIGSNGVNCLDYKNFDDSEKYIRGDIHEALEQRVGELVKARNECERQFQNKVTKITKLLDDKIMLSKTLEDIKEEYNNIEHTCQERLNIIGRHLDEALKGGA